jgi:membrane protein
VQRFNRLSQSPALFPTLKSQFEHWLFDLPEALGGRALRWVMLPLRYLYALLRDLARGELGLRAMSLVYSTLFAIVPVIAVAFAVLKAFGYHRELEPVLFEFLRPLGDQGYSLTKSIMGFVENVQGTILGTLGFAFLLYTVVSTIQKIEASLNFVWHVERPRSLARRVSEYLVVMLVGPAIAVFAMVLLARVEASDVLARLSGLTTGDSGTLGNAHLTPYLMVVALFAFVYLYMPNTRVRLGPALVGALFGGVLWGAVGAIFTRIVVYSAQTAAIYAGFAVVLLFLVWLYLSWLILLLGAQLSFYVQHPEHLRSGHAEVPLTSALRERIGLAVMYLVGERFVAGGPRWTINGLAERLDVPGTALDEIVSVLQAHGLVLDVEDDTVAPARDLGAITLDAILDAVRHETPDPRRPAPRPVQEADAAARIADEAVRESLRGRSLRDLVQQQP